MNVTVERQVTTDTVTVETNALERRQAEVIEELGRALGCERCAREIAEEGLAQTFDESNARRLEIDRKEAVIQKLIRERDWARQVADENAARCDKNAAIARELHAHFRTFAETALDIERQRDELRRVVFRLLGV